MELLLRECASYVALTAVLCSVLCIAVGMVETLVRAAGVMAGRGGDTHEARQEVWSRFARWIVLTLALSQGLHPAERAGARS